MEAAVGRPTARQPSLPRGGPCHGLACPGLLRSDLPFLFVCYSLLPLLRLWLKARSSGESGLLYRKAFSACKVDRAVQRAARIELGRMRPGRSMPSDGKRYCNGAEAGRRWRFQTPTSSRHCGIMEA